MQRRASAETEGQSALPDEMAHDAGLPESGEPLTANRIPLAQPLPTLNQTPLARVPGKDIRLQKPPGGLLSESADRDPDDAVSETGYTLPARGAEGRQATDGARPYTPPDGSVAVEAVAPGASLTVPPVQSTFLHTDGEVSIRYIGTVFHTYLLFEAGERLLMVDQHAAHERILYDRLMARYEGSAASQRLLTPQMVRLTARDVAQLGEMESALTDAGFAVEAFDATSVAVYAVPVILGETGPLREMLTEVLDEARAAQGKLTRERLRRRVAQMACKHAIKAGDTLREEDVRALLSQMLLTGAQPTCPHGRPIVSDFSQRELEKRFKRIP